MAYMQKNVNLLLLVLVLVVLGSIVVLTTVFQSTYKNLSESYETASVELNQLSSNFSSKLQELNKTTAELQIKTSDKLRLDDLYGDLTSVKDKLNSELKETKEILVDTTDTLIRSQADLSDARYSLIKNEEEITLLNNIIDSQKKKMDTLKSEKCDLNKQIDPEYIC